MKLKNTPRYQLRIIYLSLIILIITVGCTPHEDGRLTPDAQNKTSELPEQSATPNEIEATQTPDGDITFPSPTAASTLLENSDLWRGIGRLNINSTCTAVLVDSGGGDAAPAHILTNGHCVQWMANGVISNLPVEGEVIFNYFADTADTTIAVPLEEVVYSTMQGIDIAIIRLQNTLGQLAAQKIFPYKIATTPLDFPSEVRVVGAPSEGLTPVDAYLREEICQAKTQVDLLEFNWHFYDHYVTSCQDIFGGSSGSALFTTKNNLLYGLINTTVEGNSACYLGVPCELTTDGVTVNETASYATPLYGMERCFTKDGNFDLSADCPLPSPIQLTMDFPISISQPPLSWDAALAGDLPYYRYKTGAAGVVDCRSEEGYSAAISLSDHPTIPDAIPDEEGFYLLCLLAGKSKTVDNTWQNLSLPTVAIAQIDITQPQIAPQLSIRETPDSFHVSLVFLPPELSDYVYKIGPKENTDCTDDQNYIRYRRIPLGIERGDVPIRLCVIGFDNANNPTPPLDMLFNE